MPGRLLAAGMYGVEMVNRPPEDRKLQEDLALYSGEQAMNKLIIIGAGGEDDPDNIAADTLQESRTLRDHRIIEPDEDILYGIGKLVVVPSLKEKSPAELLVGNGARQEQLDRKAGALRDRLSRDYGVAPVTIPEPLMPATNQPEKIYYLLRHAMWSLEDQALALPETEQPRSLAVIIMANLRRGIFRLDSVRRRARDNLWTVLKPVEAISSATAALLEDDMVRRDERVILPERDDAGQAADRPARNRQSEHAEVW